MSALGRLVLYCFRHARDPEELVRHLGAWADLALEVMTAPHGRAALEAVLRYVMMVHPAESRIVLEQLRGALPDERLKETLMTAGEELMQKGEARGIVVERPAESSKADASCCASSSLSGSVRSP